MGSQRRRSLTCAMAAAEEMARISQEKRRRMEGGEATAGGSGSQAQGSGGSAAGSMDMSQLRGALPEYVGEGEYKQQTGVAIVQGMTWMCGELMSLKGMLVNKWEGPKDWIFVEKGKLAMQVYAKHCREARGKGVVVGDLKNFVMVGLYIAYLEAEGVTDEQRREATEIVGKKVAGPDGKPTFDRAKELSSMTGYAKVAVGGRMGYVNIAGRGPEGTRWVAMLEEQLIKRGRQQFDSEPGVPVFKDLKGALRAARAK